MQHRPWGPRKQARARRILKRLTERPGGDAVRQWLLPLRAGEELTLCNSVDVRVVRGCAEIWGAVLRPSSDFVEVVAPTWAAVPRLRARSAPEGGGPETAREEAEEDADVRAFLEQRGWPVVLCLRAKHEPGAQALRQRLEAPLEQPRLQEHRAWPMLLEKFSAMASRLPPEEPPVLMVMGNKGVGKSSCCRYLVNSLLSGASKVCYLETDLGQPELGPPGLVSLHRVRRPLLQAAHAAQHLHECSAKYFAGGVNPGIEPSLYIKCVRAAFEAYLDLRSGDGPLPPLVVNTHGWCQGFGLELVRAVLGIVRPQLVLRIGAELESPRQVLNRKAAEGEEAPPPAKRRRTRLARCGPLATALAEAAGGEAEEKASSVLVDVPSQVSKHSGQTRGPTAPETRWLRFALYFRPDLDPCPRRSGSRAQEIFGALPRGRLPLEQLRFGLVHTDLPASELEAALTGTLVALCSLGAAGEDREQRPASSGSPPETGPADAERRRPRLLSPRLGEDRGAVAPRCVAVAYVHSFDLARGEVTFFSPATEAELREVDAVVRGDIIWDPHSARSIELPPGPLGTDFVSPLTPYCSAWCLDGFSSGTRAAKSKHTMHRILRLRPSGARRAAAHGATAAAAK